MTDGGGVSGEGVEKREVDSKFPVFVGDMLSERIGDQACTQTNVATSGHVRSVVEVMMDFSPVKIGAVVHAEDGEW